MYLGWLVSVLVLLPNILMIFLPPVLVPPPDTGLRSTFMRIVKILERIGQVGCFAIPCFYRGALTGTPGLLALIVMALSLAFYYLGWARYALGGHKFSLLFQPLWGVPLPMAISPVIYFLAAALFLNSWYLAVAAVILGIGHIRVSYFELIKTRV